MSEKDDKAFTQDEVDDIVQKRLARDRKERRSDEHARVTHEPRVYALDSPNSYYHDIVTVAMDPVGIQYPRAHDRLNRYAAELAHEIEQRSPEGLRAERIIREHERTEDGGEHQQRSRQLLRETRALTSGGGSTASVSGGYAAAFVAPAFLVAEWAPFRGAERPFADQCYQVPLPAYGMQVYLPYFSTTDAGAQQTELTGVAETDPTTALQGSPVVTIAAQLTITQQLNDRFAGGGTADAVFAKELRQRLNEKVDLFALNQVIAGGATVSGATSLTANSLKEVYQDLSKGREQLTDTAGVRLRPTHVFSTYDWYSYVSDIMGTDGRPMFQPQFVPGFPVADGADANDSPYGGNGKSG